MLAAAAKATVEVVTNTQEAKGTVEVGEAKRQAVRVKAKEVALVVGF